MIKRCDYINNVVSTVDKEASRNTVPAIPLRINLQINNQNKAAAKMQKQQHSSQGFQFYYFLPIFSSVNSLFKDDVHRKNVAIFIALYDFSIFS